MIQLSNCGSIFNSRTKNPVFNTNFILEEPLDIILSSSYPEVSNWHHELLSHDVYDIHGLITYVRKKLKLSQSNFGTIFGVTNHTVCGWEKGTTRKFPEQHLPVFLVEAEKVLPVLIVEIFIEANRVLCNSKNIKL